MPANLDDWKAYALLRGDEGPENADEDLALPALVRASDFIRTRYLIRLEDCFDEESPETIEATYIAAGLELSTPGFWTTIFTPSQTRVLTKAPEVEWTPVPSSLNSGVDGMRPTHATIDALFNGATMYNLGPISV